MNIDRAFRADALMPDGPMYSRGFRMVTLSSVDFSGLWALTFDSKGDLVVVNYNNGTIDKFTPSQIKVSGSPTPEVSLTDVSPGNAEISFGPAS